MVVATTALLGLTLQMYPVYGLPQPAGSATKLGSSVAPSTKALAAANKSLQLVVNQNSKPSVVININNNNGFLGGGGVSIGGMGGIGIGGGGIEICGNIHGCNRATTKSTATRAPTTVTTSTTAATSSTTAGTTTTAHTAETTASGASSTTGNSGYLVITNHALSNVIVLEPPGSGDEARSPGINTRRPTPHSLVTSAEEDAKAGVTKATTGTTSTATSTKHSSSTTAKHKVAAADEEDAKAAKSTTGPTTTVTTSMSTSSKHPTSTTVKQKVVATGTGGCHTLAEQQEDDTAARAAAATTKAKLSDVCHVLVKPDEAAEEVGERKHVARPAAVVDVRVVAETGGCRVSVKPTPAAEDGHEDVKAKNMKTRAVDVRVVASPGGCNVEVRSEATGSTHTALDGSGTSTTARPSTRAHTLDLAVLPQPAGGCQVFVKPDGEATGHQDSGKSGEVSVHISPYHSGAGCRVELAAAGRGSATTSPATRAPPHRATKTTAAGAYRVPPGKAALAASNRSAEPATAAVADDDAVVPLDPDDIAERTGVLVALGQTVRALKNTMMNGAEMAGGVMANVTRRAAKGLRVAMDIEATTTAATGTSAEAEAR